MGKLPADIYNHKNAIDLSEIRQKLKLKHLEASSQFMNSFPHAHQFFVEKGLDLNKVREYSGKLLATTALASTLLLSPPNSLKYLPGSVEIAEKIGGESEDGASSVPTQKKFIEVLKTVLPEKPRPLERSEEKTLEQVFENILGVKAKATLEGEHLNTTYGYIGAEQHLRRYPGDTVGNHTGYSNTVLKEGIAPGLGAWGYFAPSREKLTEDLVETEKWYAVVQTLYLPDWNTRQPYLRDWYKYRKVLIVNTINGNAVVASIADSGPAAWTGKQFGGSPEVMEYLGGSRYKKGKVLVFFVDDPENKILLGPVDYNKIDNSQLREIKGI